MIQIVRRQPAFTSDMKTVPFISKKVRRLEFALISLAATNMFIVSSAVAFYWLSHQR